MVQRQTQSGWRYSLKFPSEAVAQILLEPRSEVHVNESGNRSSLTQGRDHRQEGP